jgi:flagellar basal-body rod protein FlgB
MSSSPNLLSSLETFLRLTTSRQQAITSNMANIDTPGYRTRDIDFEGELHKAATASMNEAQFDGGSAQLTPAFQEVSGLMERPDGNNVNIDRESLLLAQTQLQYQIGIQLVKHHFHGMMSAINGGS